MNSPVVLIALLVGILLGIFGSQLLFAGPRHEPDREEAQPLDRDAGLREELESLREELLSRSSITPGLGPAREQSTSKPVVELVKQVLRRLELLQAEITKLHAHSSVASRQVTTGLAQRPSADIHAIQLLRKQFAKDDSVTNSWKLRPMQEVIRTFGRPTYVAPRHDGGITLQYAKGFGDDAETHVLDFAIIDGLVVGLWVKQP